MKTIEEIKNELMIKYLNGSLHEWDDIKDLPKDDNLREFVCKLGPGCASCYAYYVDSGSHNLTREGASKDSYHAYWYALYIDKVPHNVTRESAYKDPFNKQSYIDKFGE